MEVNMDETLTQIDQRHITDGTSNYEINNLTTVTREKLCMFVTIAFMKRYGIPYGIVVSNVIDMQFERCIIVI